MTLTKTRYPARTHTDDCAAWRTEDNDDCNCQAPAHRRFGRVGSFTVHAPDDYRPRHAAA